MIMVVSTDDLFQFQFDPNRSLLGLQESFASVKSSRVQKLIVHKDSEAAIHEFPDGRMLFYLSLLVKEINCRFYKNLNH